MPAPKNNKYAKGNKGGGRLTEYRPMYAKMAYKIALLAATDADLAEIFEVSEKTINNWKKEHKEFNSALKKGKVVADANVACKLYSRAIGYSFEEVTFEKIGTKELLEEANSSITTDIYKKKVVIKEVTPDTTAQIFWLKNRQKDKWRDKHDVGFNLDRLTEEQLDQIVEKIMKDAKK
jgi:DNA-binding XRE family transcriptional regulator